MAAGGGPAGGGGGAGDGADVRTVPLLMTAVELGFESRKPGAAASVGAL